MALDLRIDRTEVLQFFSRLYPEDEWPGTICIDFMHDQHGPDGKSTQKLDDRKWILGLDHLRTDMQASEWALFQGVKKSNIFFTCAFINFGAKSREKMNVCGTSILWVDVDYVQDYTDIINKCPLVPTLVNSTGNGIHLYWRLDRVYFDIEPKGKVEKALAKVHRWVPGDKTHNTNRILRVAGTYNVKAKHGDSPPKCHTIHYMDKSYTLEEILAVPISLYQLRLTDAFKEQYIIGGHSPVTKADGKPDRSARDFVIAKEMLSKRHTPDEIKEVLTNPRFKCSNKALDPNTWKDYVDTTINKAKDEAIILSTGSKIYDDPEKGVIIKSSLNKTTGIELVELSNFCIVPQKRMIILDGGTGDTEVVECEVRTSGSRLTKVNFEAHDFTGWKRIVEKTGIPFTSFDGTERDFQHYVQFLAQKDIPLVNATKILGWTNGSFVVPQGPIHGQPIQYVDNGINPHITVSDNEIELTEDFWRKLFHNVHYIHQPSVSVPAIGWMLASIFAPQIRKKYDDRFPILCFHGDKGTGKTHLARKYMRSLFGIMHDYSGKSTPAVILRALHYSNALPILIDEFENVDIKGTDMYSILRSLFQAGYSQRMAPRAFNQSEKALNIHLTAPTVVTCMGGINDEPAQDRAVNLRFTPFNPGSGREATKWFDSLQPGAFLRSWLKEPTDWIDHIRLYQDRIQTSDRQQFCFATICAILSYLGHKFNIQGLDPKLIETYFTKQREIGVSNVGYLDNIFSYLILNMHLNEGNPGYGVDGEILHIHRAHLTNKAMEYADRIRLNFPLTRQWFQRAMKDGETTGEIKKYEDRKYLDKQLCVCISIDLNKFPLTKEAVDGVRNKRG